MLNGKLKCIAMELVEYMITEITISSNIELNSQKLLKRFTRDSAF